MADKACRNCKYVLTSNKYVPFVCSRMGTPTSEAWRCDLFEPKTPTNADRIRAMSDEELRGFLCRFLDCDRCGRDLCGKELWSFEDPDCHDLLMAWLKSPVKGEQK